MDGVLYDWMQSGLAALGIDPKDPKYADIIRREHDAPDMICGKERVNSVIGAMGFEFWANLKLLPWAKDLHWMLGCRGPVSILTSPGKWVDAGKGKSIALQRDFGIKNNEFILAKKKEMIAMPNAILIDDKPSNVYKFREKGGHAFLWPNQYLIEDGHPTAEEAIAQCREYVDKIKGEVLLIEVTKKVVMGAPPNNVVQFGGVEYGAS
jgi:5'(3')-deoxyribonucleotidase